MSNRSRILIAGSAVALVAFALAAANGCASEDKVSAAPAQSVVEAPTTDDSLVIAGAEAWAQNCIRCHNYRNPASLSDSQWDIVMHHMRVRASLTAEEHRAILRFLQAAN